jgi:hypothetical protein
LIVPPFTQIDYTVLQKSTRRMDVASLIGGWVRPR